MKSIDIFCASPGSTAICSSMDHRAIVRHGMRRPLVGDKPKKSAPCLSHLPFNPARRSYHNTSGKRTEFYRRKSSADVDDLASPRSSFLEVISESSQLLKKKLDIDIYHATTTNNNNTNKRLNSSRSFSTRSNYSIPDEYPVYKPTSHAHPSPRKSASSATAPPTCRVVELRVSIHCKGCEGKLRKYISRMEGVTSFSIDLATKKVTVVGDVSPASVLTSISKVKNAQFWPSPLISSSSSSTSSSSTSGSRDA